MTTNSFALGLCVCLRDVAKTVVPDLSSLHIRSLPSLSFHICVNKCDGAWNRYIVCSPASVALESRYVYTDAWLEPTRGYSQSINKAIDRALYNMPFPNIRDDKSGRIQIYEVFSKLLSTASSRRSTKGFVASNLLKFRSRFPYVVVKDLFARFDSQE